LNRDRARTQTEVYDITQELNNLRSAYDPLCHLKSKLDKRAASTVGLWSWGSVAIFASQWLGIAYGTYWLYSWDIMEPITYLMGAFDGICAYTFYAIVKADYSSSSYAEAIVNRRRRKLYRKHHLDAALFEELGKRIQRLEEQLRVSRHLLGDPLALYHDSNAAPTKGK